MIRVHAAALHLSRAGGDAQRTPKSPKKGESESRHTIRFELQPTAVGG